MNCTCTPDPGLVVLHDHQAGHSSRSCRPHGHSTDDIYHNSDNDCGGTTATPISDLVHAPASGAGLIQVDENQIVSLAPFNADTTL